MVRAAIHAWAGDARGRCGADSTWIFAPDPTVWDGRFANNAWLQELPKPLTKLTWDNAALVSPALARRLGLANEDQVELQYRGATVLAPVWIMPGQADSTVTVTLGYGRSRAGRIGTGAGSTPMRCGARMNHGSGAGCRSARPAPSVRLSTTQHHFSMEGRRPVRVTTVDELQREPRAQRGGSASAQPEPVRAGARRRGTPGA